MQMQNNAGLEYSYILNCLGFVEQCITRGACYPGGTLREAVDTAKEQYLQVTGRGKLEGVVHTWDRGLATRMLSSCAVLHKPAIWSWIGRALRSEGLDVHFGLGVHVTPFLSHQTFFEHFFSLLYSEYL